MTTTVTGTGLKAIPLFSLAGRRYDRARVAKVYDGDSVTVVLPVGVDGATMRVHTRMNGIDAAELRSGERGRLARRALVDALRLPVDADDRYAEPFFDSHPAFVDVACFGFDKYGRVLVDLAPPGGAPVNDLLVRTCEHFTAYDGRGPRRASIG